MAHKTITISEEAYRSLVRHKRENESFTKAILRLTSSRGSARAFQHFLERLPASEDLADNVEKAMKRMRMTKLRRVSL
jgi:predicted CopG family antitoxin